MSYPRATLQLADDLRSIPPEQLVEQYMDAFQPSESDTPVLICARDEAEDLPATLAALAMGTEKVHPIVIDNGSEDGTGEIASYMGATVVHEPAGNKTRALQAGLRYVSDSLIGNIVLSTDADTIPGRVWAASMQKTARALPEEQGGLVFGLVAIRHGQSRLTDNVRTGLLNLKQACNLVRGVSPGSRGNNMALRIDRDSLVVEELLEAPDTFPGADRAQRDAVDRAGGRLDVNLSLNSLVVSRGDRFQGLAQYILAQTNQITLEQLYAKPQTLVAQASKLQGFKQ